MPARARAVRARAAGDRARGPSAAGTSVPRTRWLAPQHCRPTTPCGTDAREAPARARRAVRLWGPSGSRSGELYELCGLPLRAHTHDVPRQSESLERADHQCRRVELPAAQTMFSGGWERVVVVMPRLAERQWREPREVARF